MHTAPRDTVDVAERLRGDHLAFAARFDDLCNRASAATWQELDEVWGSFVRDVEEHFRFEEERVFPEFARQSLDDGELVARLTAQHAEIRKMLDVLGLEIQLHEIRATSIERFVDLLREHAAVESARIYPWIGA